MFNVSESVWRQPPECWPRSCRGSRPQSSARFTGLPAGLAAVIGVYKVYDLTSRMSEAMKEVDDNPLAQVVAIAAANTVRIGTGIYLLILAGAAVVAAVFALRRFGTASR